MALEREKHETFQVDYSAVKEAVMKTLKNNQRMYKYTDTHEENENIITTIKPMFWPLLLKTRFEIKILQENNVVSVSSKTVAQPKIKGDVFKMYNGYLNDFFNELHDNS